MLDLNNVVANGFMISERHPMIKDVSLMSLRIALKSYFTTYKEMGFAISKFKGQYTVTDKEISFSHSLEYCESSTEAILHFHHFFELTFKEILRRENELLVLNVTDKPVILYALAKGNVVKDEELIKINTVEFDKALDRLKELVKEQALPDYAKYQFIVDKYDIFKKLNTMRNRLWHRGAFVLSYPALDIFIGSFILPLVLDCFKANVFDADSEFFWKYAPIACKVDPINEIIAETSKHEKYDLGKVAFLKELGRAAYENPLSVTDFAGFSHEMIIDRAAKAVEAEHSILGKSRVTQCPVCEQKTLIVYEVEQEAVDTKTNTPTVIYVSVEAECTCCSFNVDTQLKNASEYSLPIENYWAE